MLFLAEAFTRPAHDCYGLAKIGFTQSYTYFTWRTDGVGDRATSASELAANAPTTRGRTCGSTRRTSCTSPAARRPADVRDPRGAGRHAEPVVGRLHRLRAVRAPGRPRRAAEEYLDSEKYQLRPRDLGGRRARGRFARRFLAPAQRDPARPPGPASAAHPAPSTTWTTTHCWPTAGSSTRSPETPCSWWSRSSPFSAEEAMLWLNMGGTGYGIT